MTIFRIDTDALVASARKKQTQALLSEVGARIKALEPRLKASTMKANRLRAGIAAAAKTTDAKVLTTLAKACTDEVAVFRGFQAELGAMESQLEQVRKDTEYVDAHLAKLMPLIKGLANEKLDCDAWMAQLEKDRQTVEAAAAAAVARAADLAKATANLEQIAKNYPPAVESQVKQLAEKSAALAKLAKGNDRKAFGDGVAAVAAQAESLRKTCDFVAKGRDTVLGEARRKFGTQLDATAAVKRLDQLPADIAKARLLADKAVAASKQAEAPIDVKRAAKVLQFEAWESDLAKVLKGPEAGHEKGLEAIAKKAGQTKSTGRMLLAMLIKARVL